MNVRMITIRNSEMVHGVSMTTIVTHCVASLFPNQIGRVYNLCKHDSLTKFRYIKLILIF